MPTSRMKRASLLVPGILVPGILILVAGGCIEREGRPVSPCTQVTVVETIRVDNVDKVDLLFMVDNSNSMVEEQASLAAEFDDMINILASGDFNRDGDNDDEDDFEPVRDLNVGVITSDMGTGGFTVPTCSRSDFGDDGVLRTQGRTDITGCSATYPSILNFEVQSDGTTVPPAADFARSVACVAAVGTGGCGFEQQLEAILKAVTPRNAQPWTSPDFVPVGTPDAPPGLERGFFRNSSPHGDFTNNGFLRTNAVLAIIPVTDEEDCSAWDPELFNPASPTYSSTDLNLRCFAWRTALHPIERYVNGLIQTRVREGLLIYAPIVGIPIHLVPGPGEAPDYDRLIGPTDVRDPLMVEQVDPGVGNRLVPSCNIPGRGMAFPPVRIVEVARGLANRDAHVTVQSICQENFRGALTEIIRQIKTALGAACLPRPLNVESDGRVSCDVVSVQPSDLNCSLIGNTPKLDETGEPIFEDGHAVCVIPQLVPNETERTNGVDPAGTGWFYDNYTTLGGDNCDKDDDGIYQRIAFAGTQPPSGAVVRLECFLAVQGSGSGDIQIGTFCDPDIAAGATGNLCQTVQTPTPLNPPRQLACDPVTRSCGVECTDDSICRDAGLIGFVCDTRPRGEVDLVKFPGDTTPYNFCVNPTCS